MPEENRRDSSLRSDDDEQPIGHDELPQDGLIPTAPPTVQLQQSTNSTGTTKQNFPNVDLNGKERRSVDVWSHLHSVARFESDPSCSC